MIGVFILSNKEFVLFAFIILIFFLAYKHEQKKKKKHNEYVTSLKEIKRIREWNIKNPDDKISEESFPKGFPPINATQESIDKWNKNNPDIQIE